MEVAVVKFYPIQGYNQNKLHLMWACFGDQVEFYVPSLWAESGETHDKVSFEEFAKFLKDNQERYVKDNV